MVWGRKNTFTHRILVIFIRMSSLAPAYVVFGLFDMGNPGGKILLGFLLIIGLCGSVGLADGLAGRQAAREGHDAHA